MDPQNVAGSRRTAGGLGLGRLDFAKKRGFVLDLFFFFFGYSDILFFDINRIYLGGLVIFCFRLIGVCVDNCCLRAPLIFKSLLQLARTHWTLMVGFGWICPSWHLLLIWSGAWCDFDRSRVICVLPCLGLNTLMKNSWYIFMWMNSCIYEAFGWVLRCCFHVCMRTFSTQDYMFANFWFQVTSVTIGKCRKFELH